jgi:hypothetical protein
MKMGGLPCAKEIIDNGNALQMKLNCTYASILLNAPRIQPTYEQRDKFFKAADNLARVAAEIEVYVGAGGTSEMRDKEG